MCNYNFANPSNQIFPSIPIQTFGCVKRLANCFILLMFPLMATLLTGCATLYPELIPEDQKRKIANTAGRGINTPPFTDFSFFNNPDWNENVRVRFFSSNEKNSNVKILLVYIQSETQKNTSWNPLRFSDGQADSSGSETKCRAIIENFRKDGLPAEFSGLAVSSILPLGETCMRATIFNYNTVSGIYVSAFYIGRKELENGCPPIEAVKSFDIIQNSAIPQILDEFSVHWIRRVE